VYTKSNLVLNYLRVTIIVIMIFAEGVMAGHFRFLYLKINQEFSKIEQYIQNTFMINSESSKDLVKFFYNNNHKWVVFNGLSNENMIELGQKVTKGLATYGFFLEGSSTEDAYEITWIENGEIVRELAYGENGWYKVKGNPCYWENSVLFSKERLKETLEDYCEDENDREVVRKIWHLNRLDVESVYPPFSIYDFSEYLSLPGFAILVSNDTMYSYWTVESTFYFNR